MLTHWTSENLREQFAPQDVLLMYVGNLESYQGIDLLLDSLAIALQAVPKVQLVMIGGTTVDIQYYYQKSLTLGIQSHVHWLGPRPIDDLPKYLNQADILVSPRIKGVNTPMKLYSYLGSGIATLVTNLPTHTQLVNPQVAKLADPNPTAFAQAMQHLVLDKSLRYQLGTAGKALIEENFSYSAFSKRLNTLFDWIETEVMESTSSALKNTSQISQA
jgi:glycosyltransferase involved in cell wall biosynthesis